MTFADGTEFTSTKSEAPLWIGRTREIIVTTSLDSSGKPKLEKEGKIIQSAKTPDEKDWTLIKIRTEATIDDSKLTVGEYIFTPCLKTQRQK